MGGFFFPPWFLFSLLSSGLCALCLCREYLPKLETGLLLAGLISCRAGVLCQGRSLDMVGRGSRIGILWGVIKSVEEFCRQASSAYLEFWQPAWPLIPRGTPPELETDTGKREERVD